jgi:hypothetical protein
MNIPPTIDIFEQNLARFEAQLNQTSPLNDKAFLRVVSVEEAVLFTSLYKYGIFKAKQALATTADEEGLTDLGNEYGVPRKSAVAAVLTAELPGTDPTVIPATRTFVGDSNGVRYSLDSSATTTGGIATLSLTAQDSGVIGNLNNGDTLSIDTQVAGATTVATVTATQTTGADQENLEDWRTRILDVIRAPGGGGNAADYRNWSQEVAGVARAYPYAGKPAALLATSSPPDRTVYVESTTAIDADGIPPQSLLDAVRVSITTDPDTGLSRQPLGLTDDTLFVEPITRTEFFVQITGLTVDSSIEAAVKTEIDTQIKAYFLGLRPFVDGVDAPIDDNSLITDLTVSNVVQDVLGANGGSAQSVAFDIVSGGSLPEYQLGQGETAKNAASGGVIYV